MRFAGRIFCWFTIVAILFANTVFGFNNESGGGHLTITDKATTLIKESHLGDDKFRNWIEKEAFPNFLFGAHDEDCTKYGGKDDNSGNPIPDNCRLQGPNSDQWGNFFEHFYNPQTGAGFFGNRTAIARAKDYEKIIKAFICATKTRKYDDLSPIAKTYVNDYFGRIQHLMEDMGVSYHTKLELHWPSKPIEDYVKNNWDTIVTSKLFEMELAETNPVKGICIDPTAPMFKLAAWSYGRPDKNQYWTCSNDIPTQGQASCIFNQAKLEANATMMAARATKFTSSYIDQIYNAINTDCICKDEPPRPNPDHPDDNFDVSTLITKDTQFGMSGYELLDFYMKLALKKGNVAPIYMKQLMEIFAEGRALPVDATDEQKNVIDQKFTAILDKLNAQPIEDIDTSPDVAVLENGYYVQMTALINKNKEPVKVVPVDFSPEIINDHPVLVIPSAGLYGMEKLDVLKASLDEYVKQGGTLVVFSQQYGYEFETLPVPQETDGMHRSVKGYGWVEDQSCFANSVYSDTYHQMLSGQSRATPSFNVDGYFTNYPSNTTVVLRRTVNGQPAMIMYEYGLGRVIVTSMYSDFAFGSSQVSSEETAFIRDIISWAKKPAQLPETKPGDNITIPVSVGNVTGTPASQIKFQLYNPDRSQLISEQTIGTGLAALVSADITLQYTAPAALGIFHIDYMLLDAQGAVIQPQTETDSGRFAVSKPPANPYKSSDFNYSATTATDRVPYGDDALFTVHIWNNTTQTRTVTAKYVFPHMYMMTQDSSYGVYSGSLRPGSDSQWLTKTVSVGANNSMNFDHVMRNAIHDEFIYVNFYDENNKYLGSATAGFFLFHPSANVALQTDYKSGNAVDFSVNLQNKLSAGLYAVVVVSIINPSNQGVYYNTLTANLPANGAFSQNLRFDLPSEAQRGSYTVLAEAYDANWNKIGKDSMIFTVPMSQILVVPITLQTPLQMGLNTFSLTATNVGKIPINSGILNISMRDPENNLIYSGIQPFSLSLGESKELDIAVSIPSLKFGYYVLTYSLSDDMNPGNPMSITIPNRISVIGNFEKASYRIRETANLTAFIINTGTYNLNDMEVTVNVPTLGFVDTRSISLQKDQNVTQRYTILLPETIKNGVYDASITVKLSSGSTQIQTTKLVVPPPSLFINYDDTATLNAGDTVNLSVENRGGMDSEFTTEKLIIQDNKGVVIYNGNAAGILKAGEAITLNEIKIPPQAAGGYVTLTMDLREKITGKLSHSLIPLMINGLSADMSIRTDRSIYLNTEGIISLTDITTSGMALVEGDLTLSVVKEKDVKEGQFSHFLPDTGWTLFSAPKGVTISPDGFVYVADTGNNRIRKFDSNGNVIADWGTLGNGDGQFNQPHDVAVGPDGSIYVNDTYNFRIQKFDSEGQFVTKWGSNVTGNGQFQSFGFAIGQDGFIYVADMNNNRIQKFDSEGQFVTKWGSVGTGNGQLQWPSGLAVTPDGSVYVADTHNHRIVKFDNNGNFISNLGACCEGNGRFWLPNDVTITPDGFIYVVDTGNRVQKFKSNGEFVVGWGDSPNNSGAGNGQFAQPFSLAVASDGFVYVADTGNNRIQKFNSSGSFISKWGSYSTDNGRFSVPSGIAISSDGFVYVADSNNTRIQKFDIEGNFVTKWGVPGTGDGQFGGGNGYPLGGLSVAVAPDGFVYVLDHYNYRVQKFDRNGNFITKWGSYGKNDGQIDLAWGITVSPDGFVYVADTYNHRIQKFDSNGNFITKWITGGTYPQPYSVAVAPDGFVYVVDTGVEKFDSNGNFITKWGSTGAGSGGSFCTPLGVVVGPDNSVYITDTGNKRIQKFDSTGNFIAMWSSGSPENGQFISPVGIAVSANNDVYVADSGSNQIQIMPNSENYGFVTLQLPISQSANASQQYTIDIGTLNTTGKLFLETELANNLGQKIAKSKYPFYIVKENIAGVFSTNKQTYLPGETVTVTGEIKNMGSTGANSVSFSLIQQEKSGSKALYMTMINLAAYDTYPFTVTTKAATNGVYIIKGKAAQGNAELFEATDNYEVVSPSVSMTVNAPDFVGNDVFAINLLLKNDGKVDTTINLISSLDNQSQTLTIPAGETKTIPYQQQITQTTTYTFTISGSVNKTVTKSITYGIASNISINSVPLYPEGKTVIPFTVSNVGLFDETVTVTATLKPLGIGSLKTYSIPCGQSVSDVLIYELTERNYELTVNTQLPPASASTSFSVRKDTKLTATDAVINVNASGEIIVSAYINNQGYADARNIAQVSVVDSSGAVVWQSSQDAMVSASQNPIPQQISFSFIPGAVPTGNYTILAEIIGNDGAVISSRSIPYTVQGAKIVLSQVPSPVTVNPGEQTTFVFRVTNTGGKEGSAELSLKVYDLTSLTRREWIAPGETKEVTISFLVPIDLEEKDYFAEYELKEETATVAKGQVKYHLNGINISANATLDKQNYRDGDTAHLTLTISPRTLLQSINCFAKANYGGYEEKKDFSLSGPTVLIFDIPLEKISGDKLAFGVYHESGRSIHLNSLYIRKTGEIFTITTNKQVYKQSEAGTMTITGNQPGSMTINGPGNHSETFFLAGNATKSFTLPATVTAGTYPIEAHLTLETGEVAASTCPIDIAGIQVKVKEATLDKAKYAVSDTMKLSLKIESNTDMAALLKTWITYPDNTSKYIGEKAINLVSTEPLLVSGEYPLTTQISGIHKLVYGIYGSDLLLASGPEAFDVGDAVLLSIAADKLDYSLGTEPVSVIVNMYGTTAATLLIELDGVNIKIESVSLNGFTKMSVPLDNVSPGIHMLKATLTTGELSSIKETGFTYGSGLTDLVPDVWGSVSSIGKDTFMKLSVSVTNKGKITSRPTTLNLFDNDTLLSTFYVEAIVTSEITSFEYLLQVMGKAGEHSFKVVVDPVNSLIEFNRENNIVTRKIIIPDTISFTDTPTDAYRMMEQIPVTTTIINLTQSIFYPNLTISTVVKDGARVEIYRKSSPFSAPPSRSSLFNDVWTPVNLAEGTYTIVQTIMDGTTTLAQSTKTLTLLQGSGFVISVDKDNFTLRQGETTSLMVSVVPLTGWTGFVNLFVEEVPAGTNISFNPAVSVLPPGKVTMNIVTTETTPASTYTFTMVAEGVENGASSLQSIPITLIVQGFGIAAAPQSVTIRQLETATFVLNTSSLNGYEGAITLSQQSNPIKGVTVSIDKPNMAIPDETAVRIQTSKFAQPGNYTITVAARDNTMMKKIDFSLLVMENTAIAPGLILTPGPGYENPAIVTLVSRSFVPVLEFTAFSTKFGANAVMGDIDGDGEDEIIVAPGPDPRAEGKLRIYRKNGVLVLEKKIYNSHFGLNLAVGDINGDLKEEIIVGTGPDLLSAPRVKTLSWNGSNLVNTGIDFTPYPKETNCILCDIFQLGVHITTADVDGDGILEIITGPGPSILNKARIKVFKLDVSTGMGNWRTISVLSDFTVRDGGNRNYLFGINIAAGDTDGDALPEIITGLGPYSPYAPTVKVYEVNGTSAGVSFNAFSDILGNSYRNGFGVYVAARDLNGDGISEIITGTCPSPFNSSWVRIFKGNGSLLNSGFLAYPEQMRYGVKVGTGNVGE